MKAPKFLKGVSLPFDGTDNMAAALEDLNRQTGVLEVYYYEATQTLYIKYDPDLTNEGIIQQTLQGGGLA
jgi:hypothetical protein